MYAFLLVPCATHAKLHIIILIDSPSEERVLGSHLQTKIWHFAMAFATLCAFGTSRGIVRHPRPTTLSLKIHSPHQQPCFSADHVQAKAGPGPIFETFLATEQEEFFLKRPRFWNHFGSFFGPGTLPGNDFLPFARLPCSASWARKNAFCG